MITPSEALGLSGATLETRTRQALAHLSDATLARIEARLREDTLRHEVTFGPARPGHRMVGSGLFVVNPPFGLADAASEVTPQGWSTELRARVTEKFRLLE